jgi:tripartite-type tricarboxylate transporter receptor subunit TctC
MLAPVGTQVALLDQLHEAIGVILASAETQRRFSNEGAEAVPMTRDAFGQYITSETAKWARVVQQAGIKPE